MQSYYFPVAVLVVQKVFLVALVLADFPDLGEGKVSSDLGEDDLELTLDAVGCNALSWEQISDEATQFLLVFGTAILQKR